MGRKKIKIARITDDRNRSVTYLKRKAGLMKKAHELAVLTGSEVAVIVFGQNGKLTEFCSGDMDRVLLRYTEHSGPVERRGPEHYQNEDDDGDGGDGSDDGGPDDGADDGDAGGAAGGAGNSAAGASHNGQNQNGSGHSRGGGAAGGSSGRSQKRKAPAVKKEYDALSTSSTSSRRGSSPVASGPVIKVEGNEPDAGVDRGTLKAAIIQRSLSKPRSEAEILAQMNSHNRRPMSMHHHHSFSSGDCSIPQHGSGSGMQVMPGQMLPQRPSTADAMNNMATQMYSTPQRPSPPRFAFTPDPIAIQANFGGPQSSFLSPQPAPYPPATPPHGQLSRVHSAMGAPQGHMTYGDLARGSGGPGSMATTPTQRGSSSLAVPGQSTSVFGAPTDSQQQSNANGNSLMPLAHPILRQHPQYETYAMQLRSQQSRNASTPSIHTAPSSPSYLMSEGTAGPMASHGSHLSPVPGHMSAKRSASFGMATADNPGRLTQTDPSPHFAQQFNGSGRDASAQRSGPLTPMQTNPMANGMEDYASLHGTARSAPPPPYASIDATNVGADDSATAAVASQPISNAAFNDLMGSILGDMGGNNNNGDGSSLGDSFSSSTMTATTDIKSEPLAVPLTTNITEQQDDVMRSLDSEHSLSTLVNSESFDALLGNNGGGPNTKQNTTHGQKSSIDKTHSADGHGPLTTVTAQDAS